jgi:hypothetical protein
LAKDHWVYSKRLDSALRTAREAAAVEHWYVKSDHIVSFDDHVTDPLKAWGPVAHGVPRPLPTRPADAGRGPGGGARNTKLIELDDAKWADDWL